ncbi:MAG: hypothetical protein MUO33_11015 [Sedimentisphaerales bacterium]|nr:hypothetical protein [Sedimentisphaerales bacterium]
MPVKWAAAIRCNNRTYHLGYFDNEIDAARAYDRGAKKYHRRQNATSLSGETPKSIGVI